MSWVGRKLLNIIFNLKKSLKIVAMVVLNNSNNEANKAKRAKSKT